MIQFHIVRVDRRQPKRTLIPLDVSVEIEQIQMIQFHIVRVDRKQPKRTLIPMDEDICVCFK